MQYPISSRYITVIQHLYTLQNDPPISLGTICYHTELLRYYGLYFLCHTLQPHESFILQLGVCTP